MTAVYDKVPSGWVVKIASTVAENGKPFEPGQIILVNKANGTLKTERLGKIVSVGRKYTVAEIDRSQPIAKPASVVPESSEESDPFLGLGPVDEHLMVLLWQMEAIVEQDKANDEATSYVLSHRPVRKPVTEFGIYRTNGQVYKVQPSRTSGYLYAMKLTQVGDGWKFVYESGAIKNISAANKMTLEEAKQFGKQFGVCCQCGALLTDPVSVARGIGPICAEKF